jgi:hypothetical protein
MNLKTTILIALVSITGNSHAVAPEQTGWIEDNPGMAIIVLYREDKLAASALVYRPYLNDVPMAVMPNGSWSQAIVAPGHYDLWLEQYAPKGLPRGVRSRAVSHHTWGGDQVYYIKVDSVSMPGLVSRAIGTLVEPSFARKEIQDLESAGDPMYCP